jgi:hypothetical protein
VYRLFKCIIVIALIGLILAPAISARAVVNKEFSLGIGQAISIDGKKLVIKFKAVLEDSRCPVNAVCVMAGNGKVELEVIDNNKLNKTVILNTEDKPGLLIIKGRTLKLVSLNPPRINGVSISAGDYSVTLRVD